MNTTDRLGTSNEQSAAASTLMVATALRLAIGEQHLKLEVRVD